LLSRVEKFQQAVKVAREEANQTPVVELATAVIIKRIFAPSLDEPLSQEHKLTTQTQLQADVLTMAEGGRFESSHRATLTPG